MQSKCDSSGQENLDILRERHPHLDFAPYQDSLLKNEAIIDFIRDFKDSYSGWRECLFLSSLGDDEWIPIVYLKSHEGSNMFIELIIDDDCEEITLFTSNYHVHLDPEDVSEVFLAVINEDRVVVSEFQGIKWRGSRLSSPDDIAISAEGTYTFQPLGCLMFFQPTKSRVLKVVSWKGTYNREVKL